MDSRGVGSQPLSQALFTGGKVFDGLGWITVQSSWELAVMAQLKGLGESRENECGVDVMEDG